MQNAHDVESLAPSRIIGRRVREQREGRGWSQDRLARDLAEVGVHLGQTGVARLEKGARRVTLEDLDALAVVLDVPRLLLELPSEDERVEIVRVGAEPGQEELAYGPEPGQVKVVKYRRRGGPLVESRDRVRAWIVGQRPLDAGRDAGRYRAAAGLLQPRPGQPHLGAFLRTLAEQLDSEDFDGQVEAILAAREYLQGALRGIRMMKARHSSKEDVTGGDATTN
jgi:transcriptional regulator with XRE-family HTH domain